MATSFQPSVSAIVPNFNHARFLGARLASIADQQYKPAEILILDDASTDNSRAIIKALSADLGIPVRTFFNRKPSGNVFKQWRKGITAARGELVWICESDDFCDERFLGEIVPYFADPSVTLAFGRVQFADEAGLPDAWLDEYREAAKEGAWDSARVESAYQWFKGPFGFVNVIPNVGGCVFRRQELGAKTWREAQRFSTCGDWYLYMQIARGGRIAYEPNAISYFRQHGRNTSVASFSTLQYYEEHYRIAKELRRRYGIDDELIWRFYKRVREHYARHFEDRGRGLRSVFDLQELLETRRDVYHIVIGSLGFRTGGAELFPINLANEFAQRGHNVSLLVLESEDENEGIRRLVRPEIPIYERHLVEDIDARRFFLEHNVDLVHTHYQGVDQWIHRSCRHTKTAYVVTLHGSHEVAGIDTETLTALADTVDRWVYTADKNLRVFDGLHLNGASFTKLPNAVPDRAGDFSVARSDLLDDERGLIFGIASRALRSKGWEIAISAFAQVQAQASRPVCLALCGDGEDYEDLVRQYGEREGVIFLGYQDNIAAFYRICDVCVLPTRFPGESFPFTLIESLKAGTPIISTDIGEIGNVVQADGKCAGIVLPFSDDDEDFTRALRDAMVTMMDEKVRAKAARAAAALGRGYEFKRLVDAYEDIYNAVLSERRS